MISPNHFPLEIPCNGPQISYFTCKIYVDGQRRFYGKSNHGGRQLDGSRAPFDQLAEICDAVGDQVDVVCEGGIQRGTHVLKALSVGAKAVSGGRLYLYALAAAGQLGVERALGNLRAEIERDMRLMGVSRISELSRDNLRYR